MKRVLRYRVDLDDRPSIIGNGKVVDAQPCYELDPTLPARMDIWVEMDLPAHWPQFAEETIKVKVYGTGQPIPDSAEHVISCMVNKEVHHVYLWL